MDLKEHQPPLNIIEQIENLKMLGLIISDEGRAKSILKLIGFIDSWKDVLIKDKIPNSL